MSRYVLIATFVLLMVCHPARAQAPKAFVNPPDQKKVQEAIDKGADYLKGFNLNTNATFTVAHSVGMSSLVGLALLEAKVPVSDPTLAGIIRYVRIAAITQSQTYDVSLAIIFLDRLNDPSDIPMIQVLGCRLLAGQNLAGGWGYPTWESSPDDARVLSRIGVKDPGVIRPQPLPDPNGPFPKPPKLNSEATKIYQLVRRGLRVGGSSDDNSNTQFAIVGLWVAQRRGVPCGYAFRALENRFIRTQSPADHGWTYSSSHGAGPGGGSTPSMTCAGLLGLAVAAAYDAGRIPTDAEENPGFENKKPGDDDPFFNPPVGNTGGTDPDAVKPEPEDDLDEEEKEKAKKVNPIRDAAIARGLLAIGRTLKGNMEGGLGGNQAGWGGVGDLYFIWSLERVGVAFGLDTIGDVDWYAWGAQRILPDQKPNGAWPGNYSEYASTAFAILFLAKSNFVADLTKNIQGRVRDPGAAELRGKRGGPLGLNAGGSQQAVRKPGEGGGADVPSDDPNIAAVGPQSQAEKLAQGLVTATDGQWMTRLRLAKDSQGGQYTFALVRAIPALEGKRLYQARDALAERLARMNTETLRQYLADPDAELRRAACLAWAMKEDKAAVRHLIDRVVDIDVSVVRAARAGLRSLTGQDYGPEEGADDEARAKAQEQWLIWYATSGRGQ